MRDAEPQAGHRGPPRRRRGGWARRGVTTAAVATAVLAGLGAVAGCAVPAAAGPSIELATAYVGIPQTPGVTVAYVVIRNNGGTDRLVSAHTSAGGRVTFRAARGAGAAVMSTIGSVRIPGHSTLAMRPDGVHMLITGAGPLHGGKDITLTLVFARAGPVSVVAQVTNPQSGGSSYFLN